MKNDLTLKISYKNHWLILNSIKSFISTMDQTLNSIYKVLHIFGFGKFYSKPYSHLFSYVRRIIYVGITGIFYISCIWTIFDATSSFGDRIFLFSLLPGLAVCICQYGTVWLQIDNFLELFDWVTKLHRPHPNKIVDKIAKPKYERLGGLLSKTTRFDI